MRHGSARSLIGLVLSLALCAPVIANAQSWQGSTADDGAYVYGAAFAVGGFGVVCNAPSQRGVPAVQVGAHEETLSGPFELRLEFGSDLISGYGQRSDIMLWVGQQAYRLPSMWFNELSGVWELPVAMADPMVAALRQAPRLVLAPGTDQAYELPVAGINAAIQLAMQACINAWAVAGHTIPSALNEFWPAVNENSSAPAAPAAVSGDFLTNAVSRRIAEGCVLGLKQIEPGGYVSGDIDQDGITDLLLDWGNVECSGTEWGQARPYCGASHCSIDIFLSRTFQRDGIYETLAIGGGLERNVLGGLDVTLGRGLSMCDDPAFGPGCTTRLRWTGASLEIIK